MKRYLLALTFVSLTRWLLAGETSSCNPSQFILTEYMTDAKRLALADIYQKHDTYVDSIEIPISHVYPFLEDFQAIMVSSSPSPADSIFSIYRLHVEGQPNMEALDLQVDTNVLWVKQWKAGNQLTGNDTIDNLMNTYGLILSNFSTYPWGDSYASIWNSSPLNIYALNNAFEKVSGVINGQDGLYYLDGGGITMHDSTTFREYIFELAWGDCPSGCIWHIRWTYDVYPGCAVVYKGRWSNVHTQPTDIAEESFLNASFSIYPNPASNAVNIAVDESLIGSTLTVIDITGRRMMAVQLQTINQKLETTNLSNGIYFLTIYKEGKVFTQKLVVQR